MSIIEVTESNDDSTEIPESNEVTPTADDAASVAVVTETVKLSASDRRELALTAFSNESVTADAAAVLFAAVKPSPREFLDVAYSAFVATAVTSEKIASGELALADIPAVLAFPSTRREAIATALNTLKVPTKAERTIDPAAERAALIGKLALLQSTMVHLNESAEWVDALYCELDPGELTEDEIAGIESLGTPEKVTKSTDVIAAYVNKVLATKGTSTSSDGTRTRTEQVRSYIQGTTYSDSKGRYVTLSGEVNGKGTGTDAWLLDTGERFDSISAAAKHVAGGSTETNGWKHFNTVILPA